MKYISKKMQLKYLDEIKTDYQKLEELQFIDVPRGIIYPLEYVGENCYGGVTDQAKDFIPLSSTKRVGPINFNYQDKQWYIGCKDVNNDIIYLNEDCIFIGALSGHYGHFLLESLSRVWIALDGQYPNYKLAYIQEIGAEKYFEFFDLLGFDRARFFKVESPTQFKSVVIPEQSIRLYDYYHIKYKETIDKIMSSVEPKIFERLYFSKKNVKNNRSIGENVIEKILSKNNFHIIYPEQLSIGEVVSYLKGTKSFCSLSGTNMHNSLFLPDGSNALCLNRSNDFHPTQIMIDRIKKLNITYVDANFNFLPYDWSSGPFLIFPTRLFMKLFNKNLLLDSSEYSRQKSFYIYVYIKTWIKMLMSYIHKKMI